MSCKNSVETKTGVFTLYNEMVSKCEAENRCLKMGQILAPITNRRDASKLTWLAIKNSNGPCALNDGYWIGLDITYSKENLKYERVFQTGTNGKKGGIAEFTKTFLKTTHSMQIRLPCSRLIILTINLGLCMELETVDPCRTSTLTSA